MSMTHPIQRACMLSIAVLMLGGSIQAQTLPAASAPSGNPNNSGSLLGMAKKGQTPVAPTSALSATNASCPLIQGRAGAPSRSAPTARALPADARLVVFPYDRNALYTVNAFFGLYTHLEFDEGEEIVGAYINDETEFEMKVARTGHDVMIRPRNRGAVGGLTVITDRRRYEFDLLDISGCAEAGEAVQRYQRVSFTYLDGIYEASQGSRGARGAQSAATGATFGSGIEGNARLPVLPGTRTATAAGTAAAPGATAETAEPGGAEWQVRLDQLNTDYSIEGPSEIAPVSVMDDGSRTIIKFANRMELRPVLFSVGLDGNAEVVEYVANGSTFKVNRVFSHGAILKLGAQEVKIRNRSKRCGWFDSSCRSVRASNIGGGGQ